MTKREFLDIVFALAPNEANAIMNAFDEYVDSNEQHPISAEVVLEVVRGLSEHGTNLASLDTDCISRQTAIDALGEEPPVWYDGEDEIAERNQWKRDIEAIKQLPSIQPKRGRWHYSDGKPARIGLSFGVVCDQCGTESEYCTNFCGECGADMR